MQITFRASPELLKVGEIGESIVEADDSFRRQFSILVLVAVRSREIPARNKNGFKIPPESLDITERQTRDFAKRPFLERLGDFDADLQRARESAAAQPWIQQHYDIDTKLQAYANEYEKYKQHIEPQIQSETNRLLDDWYRDASVLVSEVAEWFCKAHDFEGQMTVSNSAEGGEITQMLAKWFDKPTGELPPRLRAIADAYILRWSELSGAERRARADEADHQLQAVLGDRFEKANREKEQAESDPAQVAAGIIAWYAQSLDAETWWILSNLTPREAAALLCRFNPHDNKLDPLSIITDETGPEDFKRLLRVFEDVAKSQPRPRTLSDWHDIARDKRLKYHSWIDAFRQAVTEIEPTTDTPPAVSEETPEQPDTAPSGAPAKNHKPANVPLVIVVAKLGEQPADAYRAEEARQKAIDDADRRRENERNMRAREANTPTQVPDEAQEQSGTVHSGAPQKAAPEVTPVAPKKKDLVAWQDVVLENWPKIAEHKKKPPAREVMKWLRNHGPRDTFPAESRPARDSLCWIDGDGGSHTLTITRLSTVLSEWRKAGKIPA